MNYRVKSSGKSFELTQKEEQWMVNGTPVKPDVVALSDRHFHVLIGNKGYRVELLSRDGKHFAWKINGIVYQNEVQDSLDQMLEKLGFDSAASKKINELKAPMPGLVLKVLVETGAEVKAGDPLMVLESMKMENLIKSPGDGILSEINVQVGQTVEKGSVMIKFQ